MTPQRYKFLEELAKAKGKKLLLEHFIVKKIDRKNIEFFSKPKKLTERISESFVDGDDNQYAHGILRDVDVGTYDENLNERIYKKPVWLKILKEGWFEGGLCLADHAEENESVKDICGVWKNYRVTDNGPIADLYCVGPYGKLLLQVALCEGFPGFSTVGFGDYEYDGKTVDVDSYEMIPRANVADWVINPSQQVYASLENVDEGTVKLKEQTQVQVTTSTAASNSDVVVTTKQKLEESTSNSSSAKIENVSDTNKSEELKPMSETATAQAKTSIEKLFESNLRNQTNALIRRAAKTENPAEMIGELQLMAESLPETFANEKQKLNEQVEKLHEKAQKQIEDSAKALKEKTDQTKTLKEKYDLAQAALKEVTRRYKLASSVANRLKEKSDVSVSKMNKTLSVAEQNMKLREKDLEQHRKDRILMEKHIARLKENNALMLKDLEQHRRDRQLLEKNNKKVIAMYKKMKEDHDMDPSEDDDDQYMGEETGTIGLEQPEGIESTRYNEPVAMEEEVEEDDDEELADLDEDEKYPEDRPDADNKFELAQSGIELEEDDASEDPDEEEEDEMEEMSYEEDDEDMDSDEDDMEEIEERRKRMKEKKAKAKRIAEKRAQASQASKTNGMVKKFYKEAVAKHPTVRNFKNQILASKTLLEASKKVQFVIANKKTKERPMKLSESTGSSSRVGEDPTWLDNRY